MQGLPASQDIFFIFGPFYAEVRDIGFAFFFVFFVLALIKEFLSGIEGNSNYKGLFVRCLLVAGLFTIYTPFVEEIFRGMDLLAGFFMPSEDFREAIQKVFTFYRDSKDLGMIAFLKMTFLDWMIQGTFNIAYAALKCFGWLRLVFLSALYLVGPIFCGIGIFEPRMLKSWIFWLFEVSSWNVVLSLFVRILTELNFFEVYTSAQTPTLDLVAFNLIVILIVIFFVPFFSSLMIRGAAGFAGAGERVIHSGSQIVTKSFGAFGRSGMGNISPKSSGSRGAA